MKNQDENQVDFQVDYQVEKNLINQNEKNLCLRIFKEQIDLINELPEGEREKVLYIAVVNAFQTYKPKEENTEKKSSLNQDENQNENAYISVSVSVSVSNYLNLIYKSLQNISKTFLNLLIKTLEVKEFSSNHGGKRANSGRKKQEKQETINPPLPDNFEPFKKKKKADPFTNPLIDKCFDIYKRECPDLTKLGFEPRNEEIREQVNDFLHEIESNMDYFTELCKKANSLKSIMDNDIDFKSLITNHIRINNGKYKNSNTFDVAAYLKGKHNDTG